MKVVGDREGHLARVNTKVLARVNHLLAVQGPQATDHLPTTAPIPILAANTTERCIGYAVHASGSYPFAALSPTYLLCQLRPGAPIRCCTGLECLQLQAWSANTVLHIGLECLQLRTLLSNEGVCFAYGQNSVLWECIMGYSVTVSYS